MYVVSIVPSIYRDGSTEKYIHRRQRKQIGALHMALRDENSILIQIYKNQTCLGVYHIDFNVSNCY